MMANMELDNITPNSQGRASTENSTNVDSGSRVTLINRKGGVKFSGEAPYEGLEFATDAEAYDYYNSYARKTGFGIRKEAADKSRKVSVGIIGRTFVCNKAGRKRLLDKRERGKRVNRRPDTRVGCPARMTVRLTRSKTWVVAKFVGEHQNHELSSPSEVLNHYSHKPKHQTKNGTGNWSGQEIPPIIVPALKVRKNKISDECLSLIRTFQKRVGDPDFLFSFNLDDYPNVGSVFWADGRSRSDCLRLGDVVIFDIPYRDTQFCLPFATFTGVNHHRQPILFGCALLADEQEDTFIWLFNEFLQFMHGIAPKGIITDQDTQIREAVKKVFPNTRHRFCRRFGKDIARQEVLLKAQYGDEFSTYFDNWYQANTVTKCEERWEALRKKYDIDETTEDWLPKMYKLRAHWVDAYLNDGFWAGMATKQRGETIGSFFDGFISPETQLDSFVCQYDKAIEVRRASESQQDSVTLDTEPTMCSSHPMEKQAGKTYTRKIFRIFQKEFNEGLSLFHEKVLKEGAKAIYLVGYSQEERDNWEEVTCDQFGELKIKCTCAMFEMDGIFCRHILHILHYIQLRYLPDKYMLHRWRIESSHRNIGFANVMNSRRIEASKEQCEIIKLWALRAKLNIALEMALTSEDLFLELENMLEEFLARAEKEGRRKGFYISQTGSQVGSSTPSPEVL